MKKFSVILLVVVAACWMNLFADEQTPITPHISGYASYENGQLVKGYLGLANSGSSDSVKNPLWMENAKLGLSVDTKVSSHLRIITAAEGKLGFGLTTGYSTFNGDIPSQLQHWDFTIQRAEGLYTFGDTQHVSMNLEIGYFPYKYNPDVRNLGEFLFRSFAYPASLLNVFDRPYADLMGLRVGNTIALPKGVFHHDLFLTSETKYFPLKDFSLSYVADYTMPKVFSVGLGGSLYRILPVSLYTGAPDHLTTPGGANMYIDHPDTTFDSLHNPTSITGDTGYYTFSGIKLMARASFDPKGLCSQDVVHFLGAEDGKIYSEVAILGLKNYPGVYSDIKKRIPIMLGFNIPAFTIVDVLNVELEYQNTDIPNGISNTFYNPWCPLPEKIVPGNTRTMVKWSVHVRKSFGPHVVLIGQVANDHLMPDNYLATERNQPLSDVTLRKQDKWWVVKIRFNY
jgi:hypothetical protein